MSRIYKILFDNGSGKKEMFAIKPCLGRFDDFKDEIFIRMPELKNKSLKFYYEDVDGDKITIFNTNDFAIFQEQSINKVFVEVQKPNVSVNFAPVSTQWSTTLGAPKVYTPNFTAAPSMSATSILKKLPSSASADDIRRYLHSGVICDNCDKEIRGYRYKCLECADFDLCMECEPSNHSQHLMLRIANPNDAEICYRAKLGKRFGRHRRSESLCSKPTEDRHHDKKGHHDKKAHNKRHAPCSRPANFVDVVSDILKSVVGPGAEGQSGEASGSNKVPKTTTQENQTDQNATSMTLGEGPSTHFPTGKNPCNYKPSLVLPPFNNQGNGKLKTHIDTLSNMAQHFAAMMDPFATYINETAANIANGQTPATTPKSAHENIEEVLKTLTPNNIDSVFEQLKTLKTNDNVSTFVCLIIERAINEPHHSKAYAKLCKKIWKSLEDKASINIDRLTFQIELVHKCKHELHKNVAHENAIHSKLLPMEGELASVTDENRKMVLNELIKEEECKLRRRSLSIVRFIGELYHQDMLPTHVMASYVYKLLTIPTEENLEILCNLLTMVGQKMDTHTGDAESDKKYYRDLTGYFATMQNIATSKTEYKISDRVRSMLLNLIELRKNNWVQSAEPMDGVNTTDETEKPTDPQTSNQSAVMVVDCSDDEEDAERVLVNRLSIENSSDGSQSEKSNRGDSPSREWAFVNANEIDELAQASAPAETSTSTQGSLLVAKENDGALAGKKTGTLPKQPLNQLQNAKPTSDKPSLDYSELSRRLNDHIVSEKTAVEENLADASLASSRVLEASKNQVQTVESSSASVTDGASRPSTDPRIVQALNTMTSMGFSNEGGWLNQLLEAVNGDITSAIELMTPQK